MALSDYFRGDGGYYKKSDSSGPYSFDGTSTFTLIGGGGGGGDGAVTGPLGRKADALSVSVALSTEDMARLPAALGGTTAANSLPVVLAIDGPTAVVLGTISDAAWTSGNGTLDALLKAIAGAAISTNPVQIFGSDTYSAQITTKTTTVVKSGAGSLVRILINPGSTDTIDIYDNTAGSGTLIWSGSVFGTAPLSIMIGAAFATGLTVVSGGTAAGKYTLIYR